MMKALPRCGAAFLGAALLAAIPVIAHAQLQGQGLNSQGLPTGPVVGTPQEKDNRKVPPPPALPGARSPSGEPAPIDRLPSDLSPNEALFDAINRGDIASARDALARGADLHARNVLGMSPTELSVDLGRNDITFLLLSLRGATGRSGGPVQAAAATTGPGLKAEKPAAPAARPVRAAAVAPAPAPRQAPAPAPRQAPPQQYVDAPGTPVPQAGFLGFGGR
jgi:hypothetical protein